MTLAELFILAFGLSMDAFAVAVCKGLAMGKLTLGRTCVVGAWFGSFQALMPLIGWLAIHYFQSSVEAFDHWIAFGLLAFIGIKMIKDAFSPEKEDHMDPTQLRTQLLLALATSIDALAVGISLSCTGYETWGQLTVPLVVIGLVSFVFSIVGHLLGVRFGEVVARRWKPELVGGLILIGIGIKILVEHLL